MGFWDSVGKAVGGAIENNRKEIGKYMMQYKNYPESKLEEIRNSRHSSLAQRAAADNLIDGKLLHIMDEY
ncbi:hypothetical protein [Neobacillus drentensis]|uniref:hypothetical protein n=1 Tax=Neobacillus drentensis TaxID=220684 RepID=UPI000823FD95|nr:hypothetical protein [Neobacillus drentensis]